MASVALGHELFSNFLKKMKEASLAISTIKHYLLMKYKATKLQRNVNKIDAVFHFLIYLLYPILVQLLFP